MPTEAEFASELMVCPSCHAALVPGADCLTCSSATCRLVYEIRDAIPIMLVEDANSLSEQAWNAVMAESRTSSED